MAGLQWDCESWLVTVEVVEVARVPNTTDLLGSYVVQLDDGGGLLGYKRTRRFVRGQVDEHLDDLLHAGDDVAELLAEGGGVDGFVQDFRRLVLPALKLVAHDRHLGLAVGVRD